MPNAVLIHPGDNVVTVLRDVEPGAEVKWNPAGPAASVAGGLVSVTTRDAIPAGHKIAIHDIAQGAPIRKYGHTIGVASEPIATGEHVHTHNLTGQEA